MITLIVCVVQPCTYFQFTTNLLAALHIRCFRRMCFILIIMNKSIEIKHFSLIDYNILLKVVAEYVKQYQISRNKFEYEKDMFDLTDTLYALECHKNAVNIEIDNHWKSFWVKVRETKTKYKFEIWYADH